MSGRPDGLTVGYLCAEKCDKENWYIFDAKAEKNGWYATLGALGDGPEARKKPERSLIKEVRFIR